MIKTKIEVPTWTHDRASCWMLGDRYIFLVACTRKRPSYLRNNIIRHRNGSWYVGTIGYRIRMPWTAARHRRYYINLFIYFRNKEHSFSNGPQPPRSGCPWYRANQWICTKWFQQPSFKNGLSQSRNPQKSNGFCVHLPLYMYIPLSVPSTQSRELTSKDFLLFSISILERRFLC